MYYSRYKRQYRRKYYNSYGLADGLADLIILLITLFARLVYKLFLWTYRSIKHRNSVNFEVIKEQSTTLNPVVVQNEFSEKYGLKESLLSPAEKNFSAVLEQTVGDKYKIERQVQLSRIINVLDSHGKFTNYHDFNRIKAKSIDFMLSDDAYRPILAIELDDSSHSLFDRIKRDIFVNEVLGAVGLPILHVRTSYSYNIEDLKNEIDNKIGKNIPTPSYN